MLDYRKVQEIDLKLGLLSGGSIKVENLIVKPYTLEEIKEYGYSEYMRNLQWISVSIDDFIESISDKEKRDILEEQRANLKTFDFYLRLGGQEILDSSLVALKMIFRTEDVRLLDGVIAIDFVKIGILREDENGELSVNNEILESLSEDEIKIVHRDNFDDLIEVVKIQNYLQKPVVKKDKEINPADEETKKLMEDMERHRKKVEEKKRRQQYAEKGEGDDIDISDIISAVSSKSNSINKLNIWLLTLYQLYDEYSRLELIENYDFSIRAMMAGAEKIDLKHWSSKL